ncbi:hypothetical protein [Streptomyces sp. NPDC003036]|uniref:hypothetical protein n=1 Tax=Streptomyces sp. NPDC003036 TaxID=3154442 RepID=UPI0033A8B40D
MGRTGGRGRVVFLCVLLVLVGSPWAREALIASWPDDNLLALLHHSLFVPQWDLSPGPDPLAREVGWPGNLGTVALVAGVALLVPRLVARTPAAGGRWAAALGAGVAVSVLSMVVSWTVAVNAGPGVFLAYGRDASGILVTFLVDGLVFGLLLGLLIAVVYAGMHTGAYTAPRTRTRGRTALRIRELRQPRELRERSTAMAHAHPSPDVPDAVATGTEPRDATRYLCAAAYTDPAFARRVVDDVLGDGLGAIAVSPGVDLVPVARHSLTARRLHRERDRRLAVAFGVIALFAPLWLLFARLAFRALGSAARPRARRYAIRGRELLSASGSVWRLAGTAVSLLLAGVLVGVWLSALPLPGLVKWLVGGYAWGVVPLVAVIVGGALALRTVTAEEADVDARLRGALRRDAFDPEALPRPGAVEPWAAARIAAVAEAQRSNVTCYSGFSPFIGYGRQESQWTLSLPLLPAEPSPGAGRDPSAPVTDFDAWDVVERLRRRLREAADGLPVVPGPARGHDDRGPVAGVQGARLAGLVVEDRVFVSGRELAEDGPFLPDPLRAPATRLPVEELRRIATHPDGVARHCLAAHLPLWGGEVVPSHFLHVAVVGRALHLRCERFVLGPVRRDLHAVDVLLPAPDDARLALTVKALPRTGPALWGAPRAWLADVLAERRRPRRLLHEMMAADDDPAYDRGARVSVREEVQGPEYFHHFQFGDAQRVLNALDRHALAAVRDFLDEHGVDTADFRAQTQTILNHGVLQTGGVSVVGNQAVGQGAQATAESATATAAPTAGNPARSGGSAQR